MQRVLLNQLVKNNRAQIRTLFSPTLVRLQQNPKNQPTEREIEEVEAAIDGYVNLSSLGDLNGNDNDAELTEEDFHNYNTFENSVEREEAFARLFPDSDNPYEDESLSEAFRADYEMDKLAESISKTEVERVLGAFKPKQLPDDAPEDVVPPSNEELRLNKQAALLKAYDVEMAKYKTRMLHNIKKGNTSYQLPANDAFGTLESNERKELADWLKLKRTRKLEPWEQASFEEAMERFEIANAAHIVAKSSFEEIQPLAAQRELVDRSLFGDDESPIKPSGIRATIAKKLKSVQPSEFAEILGSGDRSQGEPRVHFGWEFIHKLMNAESEEFFQLWNDQRFKTIWGLIGGDSFKTRQQFLDSIKHAGAMDELVIRLQVLLPGYPKSTVESIINRIVTMMQTKPDATIDNTTIVNQSIVDEVAQKDRNPHWRYVDIGSKPRPTMAAIVDSLRLITKRQIKEKQMDMVSENMVLNDPSQSTNPYNVLYDNLKPIHSAAEVGAIDVVTPTVYEPNVINGVASATGRRKTSTATVRVTPGSGLFMINGKSYLDYFNGDRIALVKISIPLRMIDCLTQFDIDVSVRGGGFSGQIDAIVLGLSRALGKFQPEFGTYLTKFSLMRRDPRMVERKKPGQAKARKRFQWVKR